MSDILTRLTLPDVVLTGANDQRLYLLLANTFPEDVVLPNLRASLRIELSFLRAGVRQEPSVVEQYVSLAQAVALDLEAQCRASGQYPVEEFDSMYFSLAAGAFFQQLLKKADDTLLQVN